MNHTQPTVVAEYNWHGWIPTAYWEKLWDASVLPLHSCWRVMTAVFGFFNWSRMQWRLHYWIRRQLWMRLIKLYLNCCQIWESSIYSHRILSRWKIWNANIWHDTRKAARVHPDVPAIYLAVCLKPNFMTTWKYFYENKCQPQTEGTNEIAVKSKTPTATNAIVWKHGLHIQ